MKLVVNKNKYLLFVFASWLVTKLMWSFEMSRLAFFRTKKQAEIRFVIKKRRTLPMNVWKFENNKFTFIDYKFESDLFVLHQLPELNKN